MSDNSTGRPGEESVEDSAGSDRRTFIRVVGAGALTGTVALAGCTGGGGSNNSSGGGGGASNNSSGGSNSGGETSTSSGETSGSGGETTGSGGGNQSESAGGGGGRLTWDAGGTGGTYYPLSNQFKSTIQKHTNYKLQVRSTGASVENVGSLKSGDADFALIQNDVAYFAKNGSGIDAFKDNAVKNLRGVATLYPETITVVTPASTDIKNIKDLQGKTVNTGDLGSGTQVDALKILNAVGIKKGDFTEQNTSFSQAANQIKNGDIDAAFIVGGWPVGAIEDLANTTDIGIVPIDDGERKKVENAVSYFADDTIPAGTYKGIDEKTETVAVQAMIATTSEESADTVKTVTAGIFDNLSEIDIKSDFITKKSAQDGMSIDLHEGAKQYFK